MATANFSPTRVWLLISLIQALSPFLINFYIRVNILHSYIEERESLEGCDRAQVGRVPYKVVNVEYSCMCK